MSSAVGGLDRAELASGYRLVTLGGLALAGERPSDGAASRRRSLALLAILAAAGEAGIARDKVVRYLWPGSNTARGRNSLHQTLHAIRRDLGFEAVVATPHLRLNTEVVSTDIRDFESAIARGAPEDAIAVYGGPFLDGFALEGLPEFQEWVLTERARLTRHYARALEHTAGEAALRGDHRRAVERWLVLAALDPLSAHVAVGVMQAMVAAGDRAAALDHARAYEALVNRKLGAAPDATVLAWVERLQRERAEPAVAAPPPPLGAAAGPPVSHAPKLRWRPPLIVLSILAAGFLVALGVWWARSRAGSGPPPSRERVVVLPFTVVGSPVATERSAGLVDLLAANLDGAEGLRSVDPHALLGSKSLNRVSPRTPEEAAPVAARFGARLFVLGNIIESGERLHVRAALYDVERPDNPAARAAASGAAADLIGVVDQLTAQLLVGRHQGPQGRLARVAGTTTDSVHALKSYLAGERELRAGRYAPAADAFAQAASQDTGFALAYYRLSVAAERLGQDSLARWAAHAADRFGDRLSEHDRLLVRALIARRERGVRNAEQLYRQVVDDYPDDVEAWLQLAEILFHGNPLRGRSATEARPAFEQVLALDPENEEALIYLARIAFIQGRRPEVDTLVQRVLALATSREVLDLRAFRAFALGDRDGWKRVTRELGMNPPEVPTITALQVAVELDDLEGARRFAELLRDPRYSDGVRGLGYRLLGRVSAAQGRWQVARAQLDTASRFDSTAALELRSLLAALPFLPVPREELVAIRSEVDRWQATIEQPGEILHSAGHSGLHPYVRLYRLGLLNARLGDPQEALRQATALDLAAESAPEGKAVALRTFAHSIRTRVAWEGGRTAEALAHLDGAEWEVVESRFETEALDRFTRAELLYSLGRTSEAAGWYNSIAERATYELVYVAPSQWRLGQIYERSGDRHRAAESFRTVIRLWAGADPELQDTVAAARQRLQALGLQSTAAE